MTRLRTSSDQKRLRSRRCTPKLRLMNRSIAWVATIAASCIALSDARADLPDAPPSGYGIVGDAAVAAYPPAALAARNSGLAVITCARDAVGKPHDCRITSEAPTGQGFG